MRQVEYRPAARQTFFTEKKFDQKTGFIIGLEGMRDSVLADVEVKRAVLSYCQKIVLRDDGKVVYLRNRT